MFQSIAIDQTQQQTEHLVHSRAASPPELRPDQNSHPTAVFRPSDQHSDALCIYIVDSMHVPVSVLAAHKLDADNARASDKSTPDQPE